MKKVIKWLILAVVIFAVIVAAVLIVPKVLDSLQAKKEAQQRDDAIDVFLEDAESYASDENYEGAVEKIEDGLSKYPDAAEFAPKLDEYNDLLEEQQNQQEREAAIQEVEDKAATGDYRVAIELLDSIITEYGSDSELESLRLNYVARYSTIVLEEAQELVDQKEYTKAKEVLADATKLVNDNAELNALKEYVDQYKITPLDELSALNNGFEWNEGVAEDPFENDYSGVCNFSIFHGNYCSGNYVISAEYKLSGEYDTITLQFSPYKDFGESAESYVQIYADNTLVYTSPKIQRKSDLQEVSLDIHDAEYLKIVISKGDDGCVLLSDVVVSKSPDYENTYRTDIISLATLETINGGFEWDGDYPEDLYENNYNYATNYMVYHGNYCLGDYVTSAEYKLSGKYSELSFNIAPYSDFAIDGESYVQVYVDNVILYTSPLITAKGGTHSVTVDISGAEYLKIVLNKGKSGCVMFSDVNVKKAADANISSDSNIDCLSTLSPLNGDIDWDNSFPQNIQQDDYTVANNYFIYHDNYCLGAYTKQVEYYINGNYKTFSMDFAPYSDFGQDATSTIIIYADDRKIFSGSINQKSEKTSTGDLDISGVTYLKIVIEKDKSGCIILSDAKLKKE